ncbi:Ig-like domain-containing protein [Tenacibaculum sp. IMCC1]
MKKKYNQKDVKNNVNFFTLILSLFFSVGIFGQVTLLNNNPTASQIASELQSDGVLISNPTLTTTNTNINQVAIFSGGVGAGLDIERGVAFTTSNVNQVFSNNNAYTNMSYGNMNADINDPDLKGLDGGYHTDIVLFEFDFEALPGYKGVLVEFQFGSEEYPNYVGSRYNDVFGFFVTDPNGLDPLVPDVAPGLNLATVPTTGLPVAVNNINAGFLGCANDGTAADLSQSSLYINNGHDGSTITCNSGQASIPRQIFVEFNGVTKKLEANINLEIGVVYRMKMAIADVGDYQLDSGVFITNVSGVPIIVAEDDFGEIVSTNGGVAVANVLTNDTVAGTTNPSASGVELSEVSSENPGITLNTNTGEVSVAPGVPAGVYELVYSLCQPSTNCDTAIVTVTVLADSDGDNVADRDDLDDDNDGILDTEENNCTGTISYEFYNSYPLSNTVDDIPTTGALATGTSTNFNVDQLWALHTPGDHETFSVRYKGLLRIDTDGAYTFYTTSDDGSKLFINGIEVVDNDGPHASRTRSGQITLKSGVHELEVLFYERTGAENLSVEYEGPSISRRNLPFSRLSCLLDSDNDGIPNHLDLDSDNDGCFDAVEASENVSSGQLDGNGRIDIAAQGSIDSNGVPNLVNASGASDIGGDQGQETTGNEIVATQIQMDTQPSDSTICLGSNVTFTAAASSLSTTTYTGTAPGTNPDYSGSTSTTTGLVYQWLEQVGGVGAWNSISNGGIYSNATTPALTLTNPPITASTNKYRLIVTSTLNTCQTLASDEASLTIIPTSVGGSIAGSTNVCTGTNSTTLTLSGQTGNIIRWESSTDNFTTDTDIANTTTTLTATNLTTTTQYRAIVQSGACTEATSATATITVDPTSVGGSIAGSTNVCTGTNSTTLTLSGQTGNIIRWESSTDNFTTDTDIANTTTTLTATNLTTTTQYRAIVQSGACTEATSATATITVDPTSVGGSIAGSTNVCTGTNSTTLTLSGQTGNIIRWESSTDNFTTDTDIANTTTTLTATNLTTTTQYRAIVQSGACTEATSATATITVDPTSVGGSIAGSTNVCTGTNSTTLTLSGQTGNIIRWESSTDNFTTDTDIANTTTTLTATNLTTTTQYRAIVQSGACTEATSATATITVDPTSVGGSIAGSTNVCTGTNSTTLTLSGQTGNIIRWESSTDNFTTDTDIANTTTTLTATNLTTTTQYRAIVQSGACTEATSATATITVDPTSVGGSIAGSTNVCTGTNSTTLTLSGQTGNIIRWESSTDNFTTDTDIANHHTTTLTATNLTTTTQYRAIVQSGACTEATSATATITVDPTSVGGSIAGSTNVCTGTNSTTLTLSGQTGNIIRWESSTDNFTTDTDIANTTTTLTATNLTTTTQYRAIVQSGACTEATSATATITVDPTSVGGSIAGSTNVCTGTNSTTLTLSGQTGNIIRWESSTDNFTTDTDIANTTTTLTATNLTTTTQYRAIVQSGACTEATSATATITVDPTSVGGSIAGSTNVCTGTNSTTLTLSGQTGNIIRWESSTDNFTTDTDIANTTTTLTATNLTTTTQYRAIVQSGACTEATSATATITVDPTSVGGSIAGSTNVCTGTNSTTLTLSGQTGNIIRWESSTDNFTTDTDIANTTTTLTATNLTTTTQYRAIVQSGACTEATSATATITVDPTSVGGSIAGSTNVCTGTNSTTLTLSGQTGNIIRWESSTDNFTTDTDIANTTTTLTATNLTTTTQYRAIVQSGACTEATSATATITVDPTSVGGSIAGSTNVCTGTNSTTLTLSGQTGNIIRWESSTDNFTTDTDIANTTTTLTATNLTTTTQYRAIVQSGACTEATSATATITVDPTSVGGSIAGSTNVCTGTNSTTLTLSGQTGNIIRWESSTDNFTTDTDIANTTTTLTATNLTTTTQYRAIVQSGACTEATSATATITVDPTSVGGSIAGSTNVCTGTNSTTLTLSGQTGNIIRWESSTDNFTTDTDIANTTTTLTTTNLTTTTQYRAIVQSGACTEATSATATITVDPTSVGGSIAGSTNVCTGTNSTTLTLSGQTGNIIRWESSTDNFTTDTDIANTTTTLTATNLTTTTQYRAIVQSGACTEATSATATITVDPTSVGGSIAGSTNVCTGTNSTTLTLSGQTGNIIRWESSTDNFTTDTDIANTTTTLTATNLTTTTQYRAIVQSGACTEATSATATITVGGVVNLTINDITADNIVNASEAGSTIPVTGTVGGDFNTGDTVTLTVNGNTYTGTVDGSGNYSINVPGSDLAADTDTTVEASFLSYATCSTNTNHVYNVDTTAPVPTISVDNITADNIVNATEAGTTIAVTGTVGGDFNTGDTVTLVINGNNYTGTVDASGNYSINVPGSDLAADTDTTVEASVATTDGSGNAGSANTTHAYNVDTTAPVPTISVDNITADNIVNATEAGTTIAVTGTVGGDFNTGDTVTLTINGNNYTGTVDASGNYSINVPGSDLAADTDTTVEASVATTDGSGNAGSANTTHAYNVDTTAPVPTISVDNITADNIVNATEAGTTIAVTGTVGGDFNTGDTVTLTINGNNYTGTVDASGNYSINVPGSDLAADTDTTVEASVATTDGSGNAGSANTNHVYNVDTTAPVPTISVDNITADNIVNATEAGTTIAVTGTVGGDFNTGDTVTLVINGNNYTGTVDASGNYSINVPGSDLAADTDTTVEASVATTDGSGNAGSANTTHAYNVDTTAPVPTISVDNITADNIVNATEAGTTIAVTGTVGGDFNTGDTVTLTINGNNYTGTVDASGNYSINVPGSDLAADTDTTVEASVATTDGSGNAGSANTNHVYNVDTTAPVPTISVDNITADNIVNATEAGTTIAVTGTVGGDFNTGDTVTLVINGNNYTGTVDASGNYSINVPGSDLAADTDTTVEASVATTDGSGNAGSANTTHAYNVDTTAPVPTISVDNITADNIVNATEAGTTIAVTGTVGGDFNTGDTVTLTINGNNYTGTVDASGNYSINVPGSDLAADTDTTVEASVATTDGSGNAGSANTNHVYNVDTTAPVPTISVDNITADNIVNATEAGTTIAVTGTVGGDFNTGDTVTLVINGNNYTGTVDASGNYSINVPGSDLAADTDTTVEASVATTDGSGNAGSANTTHAYNVDTTAPVPTISVDNITADNIVNATEAGTTIAVTGTVGGDFNTGDTVTLTINGNNYTGTVDASGNYSINVPGSDLAADTDTTVEASVATTDGSGNAGSANTTHAYNVDTTAPVPTISVDNITADNIVNATEAGTTIAVTGTVGGDFNTGDTVTLVINGNNYTGTVDASGNYSINVPGSDLAADTDTTVEASVATTDGSGNAGSANTTHAYNVDTTAPVPTISVDNITADNIVNATEAGTTIAVTGTVGGDFNTGDTVTLTINGNNYTGTVDASGNYSINVPGSDLAADTDTTVEASVATTDGSGNAGSANTNHVYNVDTTAPVPTISVDNITADNIVNATEAGTTIAVTGTVGGDFNTGDTVTLVINGNNYTGTVDASGNYSINVPGSDLAADTDTTVEASVATTDGSGNAGSANTTHAYNVDTTAPVPTISVDNITADNIVNATEAGTTIAVTGTVGGDFNTGDTVTLTINGNNYTGTVDASGNYSINVPGSDLAADTDTTVEASVATTDGSGNAGSANTTHAYNVDTTAPVPTISVDNITADNIVNATEAGTTIAVTGTVGGDFNTGDTVTLVINGNNYTGTVDASGNYSINVPGSDLAADTDTTVEASVATTDGSGNAGSANTTHAYNVDTTAPVPTISVDNITADNIVNATEAGTTIAVTGTVGGDFNTGDTVTLTINGNNYTGTVDASGNYSINVPGSDLAADTDTTVEASVATTDGSGNAGSANTTHAYNVDTTAPVPTISVDNITADNIVNATEAGTTIAVTGTVGGDFNTGDTVTLTINGNNYTGTVDASGNYSINVPGSDLAADTDTTVEASVATTDGSGNAGSANTNHVYNVDTTAPVPTISVDNITADNIVNATEAGTTIAVTGTVGGDFNTGDTVTLVINGNNYTGTVDASGNYSINVPGSDLAADTDTTVEASVATTDGSGNAGSANTTHAYNVDTTAPVPTISVDNITADNIVNATEAGTTIAVTGTVGGDFNTGDTVTLVINGNNYTGTVDASGNYSINVPGSDLAADTDTTVEASVATTDGSGNAGSANTNHVYNVDTTAPVPTISVDNITADNIVNATEAGTTIAVTGTVGGDFNTGDTVTLVINGNNYTGTVDASGNYSINVPGSDLAADTDTTVEASVATTDGSGNAGSANTTHAYNVDTTAPVPTISVDNITADNIVNATEAGTTIAVTGTVGGDFNTGDTVTLVINGNSYTGTVDASGNYSINVPGSDLAADTDTTVEASVATTDGSGNAGSANTNHVYNVDTTAPVPTISVDNITADNIVNATEAGTTIAVTGTVGGDFNTGDTVTLTINGNNYTGTVDASGNYSINVPGSDLAADTDTTVEASVATTDGSGNAGSANTTHAYNVDTTAPVPTISVDNITADNIVNATEAGTTIAVTGTVGGDFNTGDTVTLVINGNNYTGTVDASGNYSINVPGSDLAADTDTTVEASVATTDGSGNAGSANTNHVYNVDTTAPVPTISVDNITADNIVNASEAGTTIAVTGTVGGDFNTGDTVTLTINGNNYTGTVDASGNYSINVPGSDLAADADTTVEASVSSIDSDGNRGSALNTHKYYLQDTDNDGISDVVDVDDDNDGIPDVEEGDGLVDTDGDGIPDSLDLDSDNDGINDVIEGGNGDLDTNEDGVIDSGDSGYTDANGDGQADDSVDDDEEPDTDGDGTPDYQDLDSDNDGINDVIEGGNESSDTNGDGVIDSNDMGGSDSDEDGISDSVDGDINNFGEGGNGDDTPLDTDGDGVPNYQDLDSDNDGVNDVVEGGNLDEDGDGQVENPLDDSDGDGISDSVDGLDGFGDANNPDNNSSPTDPNDGGNGVIDGEDTDGDGIPDIIDGFDGFGDAINDDTCVKVNNLMSPNGDEANSYLHIDCIENFPNNTLEIFNRWGNTVYKTEGYNNSSVVFRGISEGRANINVGDKLPVGTYFYILDLGNGSKVKKGWIYINR